MALIPAKPRDQAKERRWPSDVMLQLMLERLPLSTHGLSPDQVTRSSSGLPSTPLFPIDPGNQVRGQSNAVPGQGSAVPYQQQGFHALQAPLTASGVSQSQQGFPALQAPLTASGVSPLATQQGFPALQAPLTAPEISQLEAQCQQQGLSAYQWPSTASGTARQNSQNQQQVAAAFQALPVAQASQVPQGPQSFQGTLLWDQRYGMPGSLGLEEGCQVPVQRSSPNKAQSETLLDLDPIPITGVAGGSGLGVRATSTTNLLDIFDPAATVHQPL